MMFMRRVLPVLFGVALFAACKKEVTLTNDTGAVFDCQTAEVAPGIQLGEIYATNNFAAFTDLTFFDNRWFAAFRLGTEHVGGVDGQIKVLSSTDGKEWKVVQIFSMDKEDLREAKFVIDSQYHRLYMNYWARKQLRYGEIGRQNYIVQYNEASQQWDAPQPIQYEHADGEQFVFWRLSYHNGKMYSAAYGTPLLEMKNVCLFVNDGSFTKYKKLNTFDLDGYANETTVRFNSNDSMYVLSRKQNGYSPLGICLPSAYTNTSWTNNPFLTVLASPNFLFYQDKLLITGRDSKEGTFKLFSYNLTTKKVEKTYTFPSGSETGYGGMSFNPADEHELWVTYYSINDNGSVIELAKIDVPTFLNS